jgi:hypothetical protein
MLASKQRNYDLEEVFFFSQKKCVHYVKKTILFLPTENCLSKDGKPSVDSGTFSRQLERLGVAPGTGTRHFRHGEM